MNRIQLFVWVACAASTMSAQVKVTYLANEGVLLSAGSAKVLIDALFRDSLGDYPRHSADVQEQLETGRAPFDGVGLALATHFHLDHWDAGAITRFLRSNPNALFASTPQATAMMPSSQRSRVRTLWPAGDASATTGDVTLPGVRVDAVSLRHGSTQNLAYRVEMGGRVLMHLGDSDASAGNFERLVALTGGKAPDVLMLPFWWLMDENAIAFLKNGKWKPGNIVAFHFGARDAGESGPKVRSSAPAGTWICATAGESRTY
jgi:L-ascorbate metabolism protein UlaG (beta-lactamase superfamily)